MTPFSSGRHATVSYRRCGRSGLDLSDRRVTSALIGVTRVLQLEEAVAVLTTSRVLKLGA